MVCHNHRPSRFTAETLVDFWYLRAFNNGSGVLKLQQEFTTTWGEWLLDAALALNEWSHLAISYNRSGTGDDPTFYVNGAVVGHTETLSPAGTIFSDAGQDKWLLNDRTGSKAAVGDVDDIRIYNELPAANEIEAIYLVGNPS